MTTTQTRRPANEGSIPIVRAPGGAPNTQQAKIHPTSTVAAPAGADTRPTKVVPTPMGRPSSGAQPTDRQRAVDTHSWSAVGSDAGPDQTAMRSSMPRRGTLFDPALALAADILDDIELVRIANENRLRQLTRTETDADGEERGFGLSESHPDVARLAALVETLAKIEHDATLNLQRHLRRHPLGPWIKAQRGIGEKQGARLLAAIVDPYINSAKGEPRTVSALWAYCGLHVLADHRTADTHRAIVGGGAMDGGDPGQGSPDTQECGAGVAARRRKGQKANWSSKAKKNAWLIADSCKRQINGKTAGTCIVDSDGWIKHADDCTCSPYRVAYDDARRKYIDAIHAHDCAQCKRAADEPLAAGHQEARAMRLVSKQILKDLWREAKRLHEAATQSP